MITLADLDALRRALVYANPTLLPLPRDDAPTVGYAVGWRAWKVEFNLATKATSLVSITRAVPWPTHEPLHAGICRWSVNHPGGHRSPRHGCACGIYAHKRLEELFDDDSDVVPWYVYGPVALWGRVIETQRGWKAQYAYPLALFSFGAQQAGAFDLLFPEMLYRYRVPGAAIALGPDVLTWSRTATAEIREQVGAWVAKGQLPAGVRV